MDAIDFYSLSSDEKNMLFDALKEASIAQGWTKFLDLDDAERDMHGQSFLNMYVSPEFDEYDDEEEEVYGHRDDGFEYADDVAKIDEELKAAGIDTDSEEYEEGIIDAIANDDDDITHLDTDGNGEPDTSVVTGDSPEELAKNTEQAKDELSHGNTRSENLTKGEQESREKKSEPKIMDYDEWDDDDEDEDDFDDESFEAKRSKVGSISDKKMKKEKEGCVSDETQKNILSTLMDYRF